MFASLHIPHFPVEALVRAEPELRESAVAALDGNPPLVRVVAANQKARAAGIELGMTKLQAEALPGLALRRRSPAQEAAAHAALLDCAHSFSPRVEDTAADLLVLDLAGLARIFGPPQKIARDLARRASDLGLEANVAVASNPEAAVLAARGFPGVTVIPVGRERERLGELPVDILFEVAPLEGADPAEVLLTLDRWGVHNCRGLAALPPVAVSERLGQPGLRLQQLARGAASRPLVPAEPALEFVESLELEHPVSLLEPLAFLLARLLDQLCSRLAARALATNELRLSLELGGSVREEEVESPPRRHGGTEETISGVSSFKFLVSNENPQRRHGDAEKTNSDPGIKSRRDFSVSLCLRGELNDSSVPPCLRGESEFRRTLRLPVPMLDARVFLKLLQLDLKAHPPPAPVLKLTLAAEPVRPRYVQGGLFLPTAPEPERLELTLARLGSIVGEGRAGAAELLDTHRPDAFRLQKFSPRENSPRRHGGTEKTNSEPSHEVSSFKFQVSSENPQRRHGDTEKANSQKTNSGPGIKNQKDFSVPQCLRGESEDSSASPLLRCEVSSETRNSKLETVVLALRRFRPPLPVSVELRDDRPVCLNSRDGIDGEVIAFAGPWRVSGEWWSEGESPASSPRGWQRDEWDVAVLCTQPGTQALDARPVATQPVTHVATHDLTDETDDHPTGRNTARRVSTVSLYRLYRDLSTGRWFIEGMYD